MDLYLPLTYVIYIIFLVLSFDFRARITQPRKTPVFLIFSRNSWEVTFSDKVTVFHLSTAQSDGGFPDSSKYVPQRYTIEVPNASHTTALSLGIHSPVPSVQFLANVDTSNLFYKDPIANFLPHC